MYKNLHRLVCHFITPWDALSQNPKHDRGWDREWYLFDIYQQYTNKSKFQYRNFRQYEHYDKMKSTSNLWLFETTQICHCKRDFYQWTNNSASMNTHFTTQLPKNFVFFFIIRNIIILKISAAPQTFRKRKKTEASFIACKTPSLDSK